MYSTSYAQVVTWAFGLMRTQGVDATGNSRRPAELVMAKDDDMKPSRELSGEELERITNAIVKGYDLNTLGRVLRFKWGIVLAEHVDVHQGLIGVVTNLIDWTERSGRTLELLKLAVANNSNNPRLQEAAAAFGLAIADARRKYDENIPTERPDSLEAAVNKQSRLINYVTFQARLPTLGSRICRVETPYGKGTGFLVGPDLVLTNYHVVRQVIKDKTLEPRTICRFDYRGPDLDADPVGRPYKLADPGILASSPFSFSDLTGEGEPGENELDYALLRLADKVGKLAVADTQQRGWFDLTPDASIVAMRDFIVIAQHAEAKPLEIAWGNVVSFPAARRLRYDTTTEPGSSGSPCFTIDLNIVALHHSAEPARNPRYNQAVPLWLVARDLQSKNIWKPEKVV